MRTRQPFACGLRRIFGVAARPRPVTGRDPSSCRRVVRTAIGAPPGPFGRPPRRRGALVTRLGGVCGLAALLCGLAPAAWSADGPLDEVEAVRSFMHEVESRHGFDGAWLGEIFRGARRQQSILDAFTRPAEAKPWHAYREIFITPERIRGGVRFVAENRPLLDRVRERFGVPPEIVAAIIGVETFYGRYTGRYRVIDALSTLAFFSPRRGKFFRRELEEYLLFLREENRSAADLKGSYAGAIGIPRFIPSSYRAYAVDFDGDGRRDLSGSVDDAAGSVGAYLGRHGWRAGEPVAAPLVVTERERADPLAGEIRPELAWSDLETAGIRAVDGVSPPAPETPVALVRLDGAEGPEYWAGFRNFYVITRYNRSALYAMAVHQLAVAIGRGEGG